MTALLHPPVPSKLYLAYQVWSAIRQGLRMLLAVKGAAKLTEELKFGTLKTVFGLGGTFNTAEAARIKVVIPIIVT